MTFATVNLEISVTIPGPLSHFLCHPNGRKDECTRSGSALGRTKLRHASYSVYSNTSGENISLLAILTVILDPT